MVLSTQMKIYYTVQTNRGAVTKMIENGGEILGFVISDEGQPTQLANEVQILSLLRLMQSEEIEPSVIRHKEEVIKTYEEELMIEL